MMFRPINFAPTQMGRGRHEGDQQAERERADHAGAFEYPAAPVDAQAAERLQAPEFFQCAAVWSDAFEPTLHGAVYTLNAIMPLPRGKRTTTTKTTTCTDDVGISRQARQVSC
jgi:hypothetical protein